MNVYFHDLPIYRLPRKQYQAELDRMLNQFVSNAFAGFAASDENEKTLRFSMEEHFYQKFGPWEFNETVGYVRLHFLGGQIRGEYFGQNKSRLVLSRKKVHVYRTHKLAPEHDIPLNASNRAVWQTIVDYVDACRKELPRRYLDDHWLKEVGPFVDWNAFRRAAIEDHNA